MREAAVRRIISSIVLGGTVAAMVLVAAPAALAKGPLAQTTGRVVITGPGLGKPIVASWEGSCFAPQDYACATGTIRQIDRAHGKLGQVDGDFWTVLSDTGFESMTSGGYRPSAFAPAKGATLGPRYHVTFVFSMAAMKNSTGGVEFAYGVQAGTTQMVEQDLYPWAPSPYTIHGTGPVTYMPSGQTLFGSDIRAGWWPADPSFFQFLTDRGMPATPPPPAANPVPANPPPLHQPPALPGWPMWLGMVLLAAMVTAAAAVGRRAATHRTLPPATA
jgi:hypothetical protein